MNALFAMAKDTILALDGAETRLKPRLEALFVVARELGGRAEALGFDSADIEATTAPFEALGSELTTNPLGAERRLAEGEKSLADWRAQLDSAERDRNAVEAALRTAAEALKELQQVSHQAQLARENAAVKIAGPLALPPSTEASVIAQIGAWLDAIGASTKRGDWRAAKSGLEKLDGSLRRQPGPDRSPRRAARAAQGATRATRGSPDETLIMGKQEVPSGRRICPH
jgi:hypothetical protein